jgi:hypothetical protein
MLNYEVLLRVGGVLQLGILLASALVPGVLRWRTELRSLSPLSRQLIWVHGAFIVLVIVSLGLVSLVEAEPLADGSLLARTVCGFIAVFWGARLAIQFFVFDGRPYLTHWFLKIGYHALTATFLYLTVVFALAAYGTG